MCVCVCVCVCLRGQRLTRCENFLDKVVAPINRDSDLLGGIAMPTASLSAMERYVGVSNEARCIMGEKNGGDAHILLNKLLSKMNFILYPLEQKN